MPICCWPLVSTDRKTKVIWPLLVEKAIAKEYGSYDNMEGGATDYALMLITGEPAFRYRLNNETVQQLIADGSLWRKLVTYSEKGFLMGAGTLPKCEIPALVDSLRDSHAYTILDALEFDGNRLLKLKDPWGISSWGGDWSARSAKWTHRMREYVARRKLVKRERRRKTAEECKTLMNIRTRRGRGNSSFYISWEDFIRSFEVIFVSMRFDTALWGEQTIRDKWTEGRAGGSSENIDTVKDNPQYLLKVAERIEVYCLLIQLIPPAKKGFEIYVYEQRLIGATEHLPELVAMGRYSQERAISLNTELPTGEYVLLLSTNRPGQFGEFVFKIWNPKSGSGTPLAIRRLN